MRRFFYFLFAMFPSCGLTCGCGGSTNVDDIVVSPVCQTAADCSCPANYSASCQDAACLCLRTEEVEVPVEIGCESPSDCDCGSDQYVPSCQDSMCYCTELPEADDITIAIDQINYHNRIAIEGETEMLSVRYKVFGTSASHPLSDLKVINQPDGINTAPMPTLGIEDVFVSCAPPSGSGTYTVYASSLVDGVTYFNNLNCYDETGEGLEVQLGYNVAHLSTVGDALSGQVFRVVLDDDRLVQSQIDVPMSTVRKTRLKFNNSPIAPALQNGEVVIFPFQVDAHVNGDGDLARLVFSADKFDADGDGSLKFSGFKVYDGSTVLMANLFDQNGQDISDSGVLETSKFVLSFPNGEVVPAGMNRSFWLRATASGVEQGDTYTTRIDFGDEGLQVVGMTAVTTPNTARLICVDGGDNLFLSMIDFIFGTPDGRSVIWSDRSATNHFYGIQSCASTSDFTNGFALEVSDLNSVTISAN